MKRPARVLRLFCYLCASLSSRLLKYKWVQFRCALCFTWNAFFLCCICSRLLLDKRGLKTKKVDFFVYTCIYSSGVILLLCHYWKGNFKTWLHFNLPFPFGFHSAVHFALAGNTLHPLLFVFGVARNPHRHKPVLSRKPVLYTPFRGVPVWLVSLA